jgi:lipid-binding SYLF domain-containing protein
MNMTFRTAAWILRLCTAFAVTASAETNEKLQSQVKEALKMLQNKDSTFEATLKKAHGYVIFPNVGKGGFIVGGAGGEGEVYKGKELIGTAKLSQATIGAQIGGQTFIEVILFSDRIALNNFKKGKFEMSAGVSAVAAAEGVASKADYENGMAVIILPKKGLMAEASVGGQKFDFIPLEKEE